MPTVNCPTLEHHLAGEQCTENLAGMGEVVYAFERNKLTKALERSNETYTIDTTDTGFKLYKFECKRESQQIQGESQGPRKGYVITGNFVLESVSAATSRIARALNNLDLGFIIPGDGECQILYDANKKCQIESGGLTTDTGAAAADDRQTTVAVKLGPVPYPNLFVTEPSGGWDQFLATS